MISLKLDNLCYYDTLLTVLVDLWPTQYLRRKFK